MQLLHNAWHGVSGILLKNGSFFGVLRYPYTWRIFYRYQSPCGFNQYIIGPFYVEIEK